MNLSLTQRQALKTHLAANTAQVTLNGVTVQIRDVPKTPDWAEVVSAWYNLTASPAFTVWRSDVTVAEVKRNIVWTEFVALGQGNRDAFRLVIEGSTIDASNANVRAAFSAIFAGTTLNNMTALAKRVCTNGERVFATGTGSNNNPGLLAVGAEGLMAGNDVFRAWES